MKSGELECVLTLTPNTSTKIGEKMNHEEVVLNKLLNEQVGATEMTKTLRKYRSKGWFIRFVFALTLGFILGFTFGYAAH